MLLCLTADLKIFSLEIILSQGTALMHYLFISILSLGVISIAVAEEIIEPVQPCTQQAIEQANNQYLQEISNYTSAFSNARNYEAVEALNKIKPKASFRKKHAKEIKHFNDPNYQPSQEFCNDVYKNLNELNQQVMKVIEKNTTSVTE